MHRQHACLRTSSEWKLNCWWNIQWTVGINIRAAGILQSSRTIVVIKTALFVRTITSKFLPPEIFARSHGTSHIITNYLVWCYTYTLCLSIWKFEREHEFVFLHRQAISHWYLEINTDRNRYMLLVLKGDIILQTRSQFLGKRRCYFKSTTVSILQASVK